MNSIHRMAGLLVMLVLLLSNLSNVVYVSEAQTTTVTTTSTITSTVTSYTTVTSSTVTRTVTGTSTTYTTSTTTVDVTSTHTSTQTVATTVTRTTTTTITEQPPQFMGRVLFDRTLDPFSDFSRIIDELRKLGFLVESLETGPIRYDIISRYDVFVLAGNYPRSQPPESLSDSEVNDIVRFVNDGGGLLLAATGWGWVETSGLGIDFLPTNLVGNRFGIRMNGDVIHDPTDKFADADYFPVLHKFALHPITEGVSKICVKAPSSLSFKGDAKAVVWGDDDSYAGFKGSLTYPPGSSPPVVVVAEFGKGRVVYMSDFVVAVDLCDNLKLAINIFKWLSQRGTYDITVLVKGAAGQPIQGALVELIKGGTTIARTKTDDSGRAVFSQVASSDYVVKATYEQFSSTASLPKGTRSTTVTLDVKQTTTLQKEETITSLIIGMIIGVILGVAMALIAVRASRRRRMPDETVLYQPSTCLPSIPAGDIWTTSQSQDLDSLPWRSYKDGGGELAVIDKLSGSRYTLEIF
jgi:hypothetical protein